MAAHKTPDPPNLERQHRPQSQKSPDDQQLSNNQEPPDPESIDEPSQTISRPRAQVELTRDVWLLIFDHFRQEVTLQDGDCKWERERQDPSKDLLALRQCSRALKQYVDPILFPVMYVDLSSKSANRIEFLSRNPAIARGVKGVEVNLSVYRASYASSLAKFYAPTRAIFEGIAGKCERLRIRGWCDDPDRICHPNDCPVEVEWKKIVQELDDYVMWRIDPKQTGSSRPVTRKGYSELLEDCYDRHRKMLQDQHMIVNDGSFAKRLASALSRLQHLIKVKFVDDTTGYNLPSHESPTDLGALGFLDDMDGIRRIMLQTSDWSLVTTYFWHWRLTIDRSPVRDFHKDREQLPLRTVGDLLIESSRRGTPLRSISINCFPKLEDFDLLPPSTPDKDRLAEACRELQVFSISKPRPLECYPPGAEDPKWVRHFQDYVAAFSAGPCVKSIALDLQNFQFTEPMEFLPRATFDPAGLMRSWTSPLISRVALRDVALRSEDLESLICKLSPGLQHISLHYVELQSGKFYQAFAMLRKRVLESRRTRGHAFEIKLEFLQGGEFGRWDPDEWLAGSYECQEDRPEQQLMEKVRVYLTSHEDLPSPLDQK